MKHISTCNPRTHAPRRDTADSVVQTTRQLQSDRANGWTQNQLVHGAVHGDWDTSRPMGPSLNGVTD
eukprot:3019683-Lingulodinium_polyedra.AAC.1